MTAVYVPKNKLAFIHIPKNAGNSISRWLIENCSAIGTVDRHPSLSTMHELWDIALSFSTVRNPWARMVSGYFYIKNSKVGWRHNGILHESDLPDWNTFIMEMEYFSQSWFSTLTNQVDWGTTDYVFKVENLDTDFKMIQDMYECSKPLDFLNSYQHDNYMSYYNTAQKDRVAQIFERDINTFSYTFEN